MRFIRFMLKKSGKPFEMKGILIDQCTVGRIHGSIFQGYSVSSEIYHTDEVIFLPPVLPSSVICTESAQVKGYVKTVTSMGGSGSRLVKGGERLFCIPRICFIIEPRASDKVMGATLMLDFIRTAPEVDYMSSAENFTITGPCICTKGWENAGLEYSVGSDIKVLRTKNSYSDEVRSIFNSLVLRPGDIIAVALTNELTECAGCERISISAEPFGTLECFIY